MITASEIAGKEWEKELGEVQKQKRELLASQNQKLNLQTKEIEEQV